MKTEAVVEDLLVSGPKSARTLALTLVLYDCHMHLVTETLKY